MFFRRLNWNVVGWFRTISLISYIIIGLGIASMIYHWVTTGSILRLGLSFTGGTDVTVKYDRPVEREAITKALATVNVADATVTTLTKTGETPGERYTIETQRDFGDQSEPLWKALGTVAKVDRTASAISTVGPSLGREYLINAAKALVIAIGIQFVYIAFRFGWNYIYGVVTIVALLRDAAMMIGIYSIAGKRVDDAFLAAVLTVIGYSVMDTIVILDRIRENTKLMAGEPFDKIVNSSILQTMTRSVNTLLTVIVTLVALLALGGASLQNFAFALLVGICSGGYHSIFFSAPLVSVLQKRFGPRAAVAETPRSVAEARAQAAALSPDRAEVLAARKARKERERSQGVRGSSAPVRYKKRRIETTGAVADFGEPIEMDDEDDGEYIEHENIDPLDAQNLGLHERDYDLGHEAINLNLETEPDEHDPAHAADPAAPTEHATVPPTGEAPPQR